MSKTKDLSGLLTVGEAAERLGCQTWRLVRLYERKLLPEPPRFRNHRLVREEELPEIERLLRQEGYLKG